MQSFAPKESVIMTCARYLALPCSTLVVVLALCGTQALSAEPDQATNSRPAKPAVVDVDKFPKFDELQAWLTFIKRDGNKLLAARDRDGHFVAIFLDANRDIVIADYYTGPFRANSGASLDILDVAGKSVLNDRSDRFLRHLQRLFRYKTPTAEVTAWWSDGTVYPLDDPTIEKVRVLYKTRSENDEAVLFDDVVYLGAAKEEAKATPDAK
jgi:hypothetical protein